MSFIDDEIFNIAKITIRTLEPVKNIVPFQDATMGPFASFGISIITLEDEDGNIGEGPVFSSYMNIMETCFFPILLHSGNIRYRELFPQLYWSIRNEGFRGQAAALLGQVDIALHDLASRRKSQPLHRLLGGKNNIVKVYGSGGGTNYSYAELEEEIGFFLNAGIDCFKMKVGKNFGTRLQEDVERVKFVKQLTGSKCKLAIDVNQVWKYEDVLEFMDKVADQNIAWLEEPVHSASYDQIERLCSALPVAISYGESERTSRMFPTLVQLGVKHLQPVPTQIGGVNEWMEVRDLAAKNNLTFSSGGYSFYTNCLLATTQNNVMLEYLHCIMFGLEKYLLVKPALKNGMHVLPEVSGLPVRINWDYCTSEKKIIKSHFWNRQNVKKYTPLVTL
ncbi:enolase C-terminal domain-like protein [Danxiaibacter flavus]|uniref:Enolase C-terminal domain-like protein n=1 Tax=Danxiaibacter flavus TaxID=3049108 RepID=A0ABV3ZI11_9BACT|nr:enolase C-terminal domain-like protein [Chitinophagaceae bacterium DXS]